MTDRIAWLMDCSINEMPMACFQERSEYTESLSTRCFKDEHEALLEISLFEHEKIWQELANR